MHRPKILNKHNEIRYSQHWYKHAACPHQFAHQSRPSSAPHGGARCGCARRPAPHTRGVSQSTEQKNQILAVAVGGREAARTSSAPQISRGPITRAAHRASTPHLYLPRSAQEAFSAIAAVGTFCCALLSMHSFVSSTHLLVSQCPLGYLQRRKSFVPMI